MSSSFQFDVYLYTSTQFANVRVLLLSLNSVQFFFKVNGVETKFFFESVGTCICNVANFCRINLACCEVCYENSGRAKLDFKQ